MRFTNAIAVAAAAATCANAFDMEMIQTGVQEHNFFKAYEGVFGYRPTTRHDVNRAFAERTDRVGELSHKQRLAATNAHHSLMAQRDRLGLAKVGAGTGPNVGQDFEALNSFAGFVLNFFRGLSYGQDTSNSRCYRAVEDLIISVDTTTDILRKIYIPAYVPELQVLIQDSVSVGAAFYIDCNLDQLFLTVSHLISTEGVSELTGRVAGALPFEISRCMAIYSNPEEYTTQEKGVAYGKCASIVLNYNI